MKDMEELLTMLKSKIEIFQISDIVRYDYATTFNSGIESPAKYFLQKYVPGRSYCNSSPYTTGYGQILGIFDCTFFIRKTFVRK